MHITALIQAENDSADSTLLYWHKSSEKFVLEAVVASHVQSRNYPAPCSFILFVFHLSLHALTCNNGLCK